MCVCVQVESILLHAETSEETKKAKQRGIDQRNTAIEWIRERCTKCKGRGTCEGVVYFMDDDNTYDIRLFEKVSAFSQFWGGNFLESIFVRAGDFPSRSFSMGVWAWQSTVHVQIPQKYQIGTVDS